MHKNIPNENFVSLAHKINSLLKDRSFSYWLGRGMLRDFVANGNLKFQHGDLDFHVLAEDRDILRKYLIPILEKEGYSIEDKDYKLAFRKPFRNPDFYVEFPYIFQDEKNREFVYHIANGKKEVCKKECFFGDEGEFIELDGEKIRVPNNPEAYLEGVYGKNWHYEHLREEPAFMRRFGLH